MAKRTKTGGREQGTPNRLTGELREALKEIIFQEFERLPERFDKLEPKDRIELLTKLLPYVLPKVEPMDSNYDAPGGLTSWDNLF